MKSINIFGKNIPIKTVKDLKDEDGNQVAGLYHYKGKIEINDDLKGEEYKQALMHEILHAVIDRIGMRDQPGWNLFYEEMIVDQFATFLTEEFDFNFD